MRDDLGSTTRVGCNDRPLGKHGFDNHSSKWLRCRRAMDNHVRQTHALDHVAAKSKEVDPSVCR